MPKLHCQKKRHYKIAAALASAASLSAAAVPGVANAICTFVPPSPTNTPVATQEAGTISLLPLMPRVLTIDPPQSPVERRGLLFSFPQNSTISNPCVPRLEIAVAVEVGHAQK